MAKLLDSVRKAEANCIGLDAEDTPSGLQVGNRGKRFLFGIVIRTSIESKKSPSASLSTLKDLFLLGAPIPCRFVDYGCALSEGSPESKYALHEAVPSHVASKALPANKAREGRILIRFLHGCARVAGYGSQGRLYKQNIDMRVSCGLSNLLNLKTFPV